MSEDDKLDFGVVVKDFKEKMPQGLDVAMAAVVKKAAIGGILNTPEGEETLRANLSKESKQLQVVLGDRDGDGKSTSRELAATFMESSALLKDRNGDGIVVRDEVSKNLDEVKSLLAQSAMKPLIANEDPLIQSAIVAITVPKEGRATTKGEQAFLLKAEESAKDALSKPDEVVFDDTKGMIKNSMDKALKEYKDNAPKAAQTITLDGISKEDFIITPPNQPEGTQRPTVSSGREAG